MYRQCTVDLFPNNHFDAAKDQRFFTAENRDTHPQKNNWIVRMLKLVAGASFELATLGYETDDIAIVW
tara:strand:- start:11 stop:214 length:204 start_codon:yes stop_codon:yes gene_type:complete